MFIYCCRKRVERWIKSAVFLLVVIFSITGNSYATPFVSPRSPDIKRLFTPQPDYSTPLLAGIKFDPKNPLNLEFLIDTASAKTVNKQEAMRLVHYFMAGLTIPQEKLWVNLSPYERSRIVEDDTAATELGEILLEEDYLLKQLAASLTYPETAVGKEYWRKLLRLSVNNFQKVWITPDKARVYEKGNAALITQATLKAMVEEDYIALRKASAATSADAIAFKEHILPLIQKDVDSGKDFSALRQVYRSLILAFWFKDKFKKSFYQDYIDSGAVKGIDLAAKDVKEKVYEQYVTSFKNGAYSYSKKELDVNRRKVLTRKYFCGGVTFASTQVAKDNKAPGVLLKDQASGELYSIRGAMGPIENRGDLDFPSRIIDDGNDSSLAGWEEEAAAILNDGDIPDSKKYFPVNLADGTTNQAIIFTASNVSGVASYFYSNKLKRYVIVLSADYVAKPEDPSEIKKNKNKVILQALRQEGREIYLTSGPFTVDKVNDSSAMNGEENEELEENEKHDEQITFSGRKAHIADYAEQLHENGYRLLPYQLQELEAHKNDIQWLTNIVNERHTDRAGHRDVWWQINRLRAREYAVKKARGEKVGLLTDYLVDYERLARCEIEFHLQAQYYLDRLAERMPEENESEVLDNLRKIFPGVAVVNEVLPYEPGDPVHIGGSAVVVIKRSDKPGAVKTAFLSNYDFSKWHNLNLMIENEAKWARALEHIGVTFPVRRVGYKSGEFWFETETWRNYASGDDINVWKSFSAERKLFFAGAMAGALYRLQNHRINGRPLAHNDIKPANYIFNLDTGEVKLIDLGNACMSGNVDYSFTPGYEPPEIKEYLARAHNPDITPEERAQAQQQCIRTPEQDIYSLGKSLDELLLAVHDGDRNALRTEDVNRRFSFGINSFDRNGLPSIDFISVSLAEAIKDMQYHVKPDRVLNTPQEIQAYYDDIFKHRREGLRNFLLIIDYLNKTKVDNIPSGSDAILAGAGRMKRIGPQADIDTRQEQLLLAARPQFEAMVGVQGAVNEEKDGVEAFTIRADFSKISPELAMIPSCNFTTRLRNIQKDAKEDRDVNVIVINSQMENKGISFEGYFVTVGQEADYHERREIFWREVQKFTPQDAHRAAWMEGIAKNEYKMTPYHRYFLDTATKEERAALTEEDPAARDKAMIELGGRMLKVIGNDALLKNKLNGYDIRFMAIVRQGMSGDDAMRGRAFSLLQTYVSPWNNKVLLHTGKTYDVDGMVIEDAMPRINRTDKVTIDIEDTVYDGGCGYVIRRGGYVVKIAKKIVEVAGSSLDLSNKIMAEEIAQMLDMESKGVKGIPKLYDCGVNEDGAIWYKMEDAGEDIQYSERWRTLPLEERIDYFIAVARQLQTMHDAGFVHRDIKGQNLMLSSDGTPRIIDFGLADVIGGNKKGGTEKFFSRGYITVKELADNGVSDAPNAFRRLVSDGYIDNNGVILNKTPYEDNLGKAIFDVLAQRWNQAMASTPAFDVYSLGMTMGDMILSGMDKKAVQQQCEDTGLIGLLQDMIVHNPDERIQTMREVANTLRAIKARMPVATMEDEEDFLAATGTRGRLKMPAQDAYSKEEALALKNREPEFEQLIDSGVEEDIYVGSVFAFSAVIVEAPLGKTAAYRFPSSRGKTVIVVNSQLPPALRKMLILGIKRHEGREELLSRMNRHNIYSERDIHIVATAWDIAENNYELTPYHKWVLDNMSEDELLQIISEDPSAREYQDAILNSFLSLNPGLVIDVDKVKEYNYRFWLAANELYARRKGSHRSSYQDNFYAKDDLQDIGIKAEDGVFALPDDARIVVGGQAVIIRGDEGEYIRMPKDPAHGSLNYKQFIDELEIVKRLEDANVSGVPRIVSAGPYYDGRVYARMRGIEGESLDKVMDKFDSRQKLNILYQVAAILKQLHKNNVLHNDIKPENIIVSKNGEIMLIDFGIASAPGGKPRYSSNQYAAPEVREGALMENGKLTPQVAWEASDIYSLGVLAQKLLGDELAVYGLTDIVAQMQARIFSRRPDIDEVMDKFNQNSGSSNVNGGIDFKRSAFKIETEGQGVAIADKGNRAKSNLLGMRFNSQALTPVNKYETINHYLSH